MSCCPPTALPPVPTTSDKASVQMGSATVFFYDNPNSDLCVLVFPDVFGTDSGRTKDNSVKLSGLYKVALIQFDAKSNFPMNPEDKPWIWPIDWIRQFVNTIKVVGWVSKRKFDTLRPKIDDVVAHLKASHGVAKFAAMGYCWGGWVVGKYSSIENTPITCGISFHPSWRVEDVVEGYGKGQKMGQQIRVPQLLLTAKDDSPYLKPGGAVEGDLMRKPFKSKARVFPEMRHGWVNRGDLSDPAIDRDFHAAWDEEALPFLQDHF
ncbi:unnamed protein product [Aphanomyces euteiches]